MHWHYGWAPSLHKVKAICLADLNLSPVYPLSCQMTRADRSDLVSQAALTKDYLVSADGIWVAQEGIIFESNDEQENKIFFNLILMYAWAIKCLFYSMENYDKLILPFTCAWNTWSMVSLMRLAVININTVWCIQMNSFRFLLGFKGFFLVCR